MKTKWDEFAEIGSRMASIFEGRKLDLSQLNLLSLKGDEEEMSEYSIFFGENEVGAVTLNDEVIEQGLAHDVLVLKPIKANDPRHPFSITFFQAEMAEKKPEVKKHAVSAIGLSIAMLAAALTAKALFKNMNLRISVDIGKILKGEL